MKCLALAVVVSTLLAECAYACCGMTTPHTHTTTPSPSVPSVPGTGAVDSAVRDAREAADVKAKIRAKNPDATDEQVEAGTKKVIGERRRREREAEDAGKTHITRTEAREKYRKAIEKNKDRAREKGISDDDLKKRIKAAILKKYAIDDDPAPPAHTETVASVEPPAVSPPQDPPPPPPERTKIISLQEIEAIKARLEEKKRREAEAERNRLAALEEQRRQQAAAQAYNESRSYDKAMQNWIDHHTQLLPDGTHGLASDWNAALAKKYYEDTKGPGNAKGVDLFKVWEEQETAQATGQQPIWRETPVPPKEPFKPQSSHFSENDPRPERPANYVPK